MNTAGIRYLLTNRKQRSRLRIASPNHWRHQTGSFWKRRCCRGRTCASSWVWLAQTQRRIGWDHLASKTGLL